MATPDEVDQILRAAESNGGTITISARRPPQFDGYHGYFVDPDGHAWEIAHNPGFPLTNDGLLDLP